MSVFLFLAGVVIIINTNYSEVSASTDNGTSFDNPLRQILNPGTDNDKNTEDNNTNDKKAYNVLVLGGDEVAGNTDTIIFANYNPAVPELTLMSIPRDTRVNVKGCEIPKINAAYPLGGGKLALECISDLLEVKIENYVYIDTNVFCDIIDILDGVNYYIPVDMDYDDPLQDLHIHLKKGQQTLNGKQAEGFMRFRQPSGPNGEIVYDDEILEYYDGSDMKRIKAQQSFIKELIRQKLNIKYITKINNIIEVIFENLKTNVSLKDILYMSTSVYKLNMEKVNILKLPGEPVFEDELWFYKHNKQETEEIMQNYFNKN